MSAARNVVPIRSPMDPEEGSSSERAHRRSISIHRPNEPEDAMSYRVALATIRDQASDGLYRCCDEAVPLLQAVSSQAAAAVFAPLSTKRLYLLRGALALTMEAARAIERAVRA